MRSHISELLQVRIRTLQFLLYAFAPGNVARRGKNAFNFSSRVLVHRGVVEHLGNTACLVADRQGIVPHSALLKCLSATLPRFLRLREVIAKVAANQLL